MSAGLSEVDAYEHIYADSRIEDYEPYIDLTPRQSKTAILIGRVLGRKSTGIGESEAIETLYPPSTPPEGQDPEGVVVLSERYEPLSQEAIATLASITGWIRRRRVNDLVNRALSPPPQKLLQAKLKELKGEINPEVPKLIVDVISRIDQSLRHTPLERSVWLKFDLEFAGFEQDTATLIRQAEEFINTRQGVAAHTKYAARPGDKYHILVVCW